MVNRVLTPEEEARFKKLEDFYQDVLNLYLDYEEDNADMIWINDISSLLSKFLTN